MTEDQLTAYTQQIKEFLESRPFISLHALEKAASIPRNTIYMVFSGRRNTFGHGHVVALFRELEAYGLKKKAL